LNVLFTEKECFVVSSDFKMPDENQVLNKSSEGIFEQASYDDDGVITDFNNLPDEVLLGVEKSDARSTWAWKRKFQVSLANWMQFGCK
ncbi:hypothetical protein Tco_0666261, partial [Tanacetum coccineum]